MALKVELKPHERIIVGNVVITNSENRARFFIDGHAPILREKDILTPETANSPAKKIYLAVQLMYLANDVGQYQKVYFNLVREFIEAAPSALGIVAEINSRILSNDIYKALKVAKKLIDYELELMSYATRG